MEQKKDQERVERILRKIGMLPPQKQNEIMRIIDQMLEEKE